MMIGAFQQEEREQPATLPQYLEALHRRDESIIAWEQFFRAWDTLICPASMITAFPHCEPGAPLHVDGQDVNYWMVSAHGTLFNYTGHPAVVLPFKLDRDGLPIGVQLVGKRWNESAGDRKGSLAGNWRIPATTGLLAALRASLHFRFQILASEF